MAEHPTPTDAEPRALLPWTWIVIGVVTVGLFVVYPPFRVASKAAPRTNGGGATPVAFDAAAFARDFWANKLLPAAVVAPDAGPMLAALQRDPAAAARAHAHRVGLGSAAYYLARGSGRVTAVERNRLLVEVGGAVVAIRTGPVFGNSVRDGCGLLDVNDVPGLAEFNALSAELNRLVEERVQPTLAGATVGMTLNFAGCAEAPESLAADGPLLTFIPIQAELTR